MSNNGVEDLRGTPGTTLVGEQAGAKDPSGSRTDPRTAPRADTEIVVRLGDNPAAAAELGRAAEQSLQTGVPLRVVHAWQLTASPSGEVSASFRVASAADARARATRWVLDTLGESASTVRWVLDIVELPPGVIVPVDAHAAEAAPDPPSAPGGNA